jgi:hypothetical protein
MDLQSRAFHTKCTSFQFFWYVRFDSFCYFPAWWGPRLSWQTRLISWVDCKRHTSISLVLAQNIIPVRGVVTSIFLISYIKYLCFNTCLLLRHLHPQKKKRFLWCKCKDKILENPKVTLLGLPYWFYFSRFGHSKLFRLQLAHLPRSHKISIFSPAFIVGLKVLIVLICPIAIHTTNFYRIAILQRDTCTTPLLTWMGQEVGKKMETKSPWTANV